MPAALLRPARVRVPCSTSNLGAGFDTIGLAFDRCLTASFTPGARRLEVERSGTCAALSDERDTLLQVFQTRLEQRDVVAEGRLAIDSAIPVARGLGSSAAAAVGGLLLADAVLRQPAPDRLQLLAMASGIEGHADNAAPALFGGLIAVAQVSDTIRAFRLPLSPEIGFSYAAPDMAVSTSAARAALPERVPHSQAARALGRMAALVQGLATADPELLKLGFEDDLHVPYRLPLIPNAGYARDAALAAGAWAVTISGSGSGLIALSVRKRADAVAEAMAAAFGQADPAYFFSAQPETEGALVEVEPA